MRSLPVEVLEIIVQATSTQDQLSLCIASKLVNELAVRSLYKRVDLARSPAKAVRCCKTLVSNKAAALAVREIRIADGVPGSHYLRGYYHLVEKVLQFLPRLAELALLTYTTLFTNVIDHCTLPSLLRFVVTSPVTASVVAFIRRHPQIQFLSYGGLAFNAQYFGHIDLPALISYLGPAHFIPNILAMAPVRKLVLTWNIGDPSLYDSARGYYDRIFASLVCASVVHLDVMTRDWNLALVSAISESFPLLQVIVLRKAVVAAGGVAINNLYDSLRDALPAFQRLHTITLAHIDEMFNPVSSSDLENELEVVMGWADIRPSINRCALPSGVTWFRIRGAWFPNTQGSNRSLVAKWQLSTMASGKYPALTKCIFGIFEGAATSSSGRQLLAQYSALILQLEQVAAERGSGSAVGGSGGSGGEERSENDPDPDDADAAEDPDGEEGNHDDADQDSEHTADAAESAGDSDGEEEVNVDEDQL